MKITRTAGLVIFGVLLMACSEPECFDLVYNSATETCDCPIGTTPNFALQVCEGPSGVIPWTNLEPGLFPMPSGDAGVDGGQVDAPDSGGDVGVDGMLPDARPDMDAGPPPAATMAIFPWNGYMTGSIHVAEDALVVDHPLRPKLMWDEVVGAGAYQVQMTRACATARFRACSFDRTDVDEIVSGTVFRPTEPLVVSARQPVGSRYFWRVRACAGEACSDWTEIRYVDVGREQNDYNGDGYADIAVGAPGQSNPVLQEGNVFVYLGNGDASLGEPTIVLDNPEGHRDGFFGRIASAGDVNGDGYGDLLVGASGQRALFPRKGAAYLYLGGPEGIQAMPSRSFQNEGIPIDEQSDYATDLAGVGDLNGDGYGEFAISAGSQDAPGRNEGRVYLYFGAEHEPGSRMIVLNNPTDDTESLFGPLSTTSFDVQGDGYCDLLVGARGSGTVYLFSGVTDGISDDPIAMADDAHTFGFGLAVAGADLNGDGFGDIVVGSPFQSTPEASEGNVHVFSGSRSGPPSTPSYTLDSPASQAQARFGFVIECPGDVDGDGFLDLVVAAILEDSRMPVEGVVHLYLGSDDRVGGERAFVGPSHETQGFFGLGLASGDTNGDGFSDIVVGAPGQNGSTSNEGAAYLLLGLPRGPSTTALPIQSMTPQESAAFGSL